LHPSSAPPQVPRRRYRTVSYWVVLPQVAMVAWPDDVGVHWKTVSGPLSLAPQLPLWVLLPVVTPLNEPPAAGTIVGLAQASAAGVLVDDGDGVGSGVGVSGGEMV